MDRVWYQMNLFLEPIKLVENILYRSIYSAQLPIGSFYSYVVTQLCHLIDHTMSC